MSSASRFSRIRIDTNVAHEFGTLSEQRSAETNEDSLTSRPEVPSVLISPYIAGEDDHDANLEGSANSHKGRRPTRGRARDVKGIHAMRKLLAHVLTQLLNRRRPPAIADTIKEVGRDATERGVASFTDVFKDIAKIGKAIQRNSTVPGAAGDEGDEDEEGSQTYSTEETFDLLAQLKDALAMSIQQGWHIFEDDPFYQEAPRQREEKSTSRLRRSRQSFQSPGRRSRSPSPAGKQNVHVPELLTLCISVLSSIILEDCRFKILSPRPSRPPNALQALSLTVAQFLIHTHRYEPNVISRIGYAIIPAFTTFQPEMHGRLILFFEQSVIRGILGNLRQSQGFDTEDPSSLIMSPITRIDTNPFVSILIDEVQEQSQDAAHLAGIKVQSSSAPHQESSIYHLASLVAPLLAAILETVDIGALDSTHELAVRFHQLLDVIINLKVDAYNDLLAIVAYHTARSRKQACAILASLWPKIVGHVSISRSFYIPVPPEWARFPPRISTEYSHNKHQFVPWRFVQQSNRSNETTPQHPCSACAQPIDGFGLLCPFCMCSVHFDCYDAPEGNSFLQYRMAKDLSGQKLAMYRFSYLLPSRDVGDPLFTPQGHTFKAINLFTLCPCHICAQPLWGGLAQAVKCTDCAMIIHPACVTSPSLSRCAILNPTSDQLTMDIKDLRRSAVNYFTELRWTYEHLNMLSYEEVAIIFDILQMQISLLDNGIALGSIIVMQGGESASYTKIEEFELHRTAQWCKELLQSQRLPKSGATADYMEENNIESSHHSVLYDFSYLVYLVTGMKSPICDPTAGNMHSSDLLNVRNHDIMEEMPGESTAHPYEAVPLSHLRETLNVEFNIHTSSVIKVLLTHLHHLSFFERLDSQTAPISDTLADGAPDAICVFPLPLGLDLSTDVETLVTAVEVCLLDLDLSVNEFAFLLLVRRFWPNGLMSDYGLKRLTRSILAWIIAEDDNLATILREYIAKQRILPGVRHPSEVPPWPASRFARGPPDSPAVGNGRDYIQARRALLARYAEPWLSALHFQDADTYADIVFDACVELAEDRTVNTEMTEVFGVPEVESPARLNEVLYCISKVTQSWIAFSASDQLVLRWLRMATQVGTENASITGLYRIFPKSVESGTPVSIFMSPTIQSPKEKESSPPLHEGPFSTLLETGSRSEGDLNQALTWLLMVAKAGIELPPSVLEQFSGLVNRYPNNLENAQLFAHTLMVSFWLKSLGRQSLQLLVSRLLSKFEAAIINGLRSNNASVVQTSMELLRRSLAACTLIYGCDRPTILQIQFIMEEDVKELPSRRRLMARASNVVDPVLIDPAILHTIGQCLRLDIAIITAHIAKFFHLYFHSPFVAPYEIDNFILRNSALVAQCAWKFYGVEKHSIDSIRSEFLVRVLAVDSESFQGIVDDGLDSNFHWERRLKTVSRLTRILNDVTSPAFDADGRQWRSSVADVFSSFFSVLWKDPNEEVRLAVQTVCTGLLPPQLDAISECWNEALAKSPMKHRMRLVAFLLQLRSHFPSWKMITWDTLVETMVEFHYETPPNTAGSQNVQPPHLSQSNPDMAHLVVSLLLLAMSMLSDGIAIDQFSLLKIKVQLVKILGFSNVTVTPLSDPSAFLIQYGEASTIPDIAFPCLDYLVALVDAAHTTELQPSVVDPSSNDQGGSSPVDVLVGYVFIDVIFNLVGTLEKLDTLPVLTLKALLECIYIIVHKHDFEVWPTGSLQRILRKSVLCVAELVSKNINYEIRQLALTVTQAFLKRCFNFLGSIIPPVLEQITELVAPHAMNNQDGLISQGRSILLATLKSHSGSGLLVGLFKRPLKPSFFTVLRQMFASQETVTDPFAEPLPATLLRDTLFRAADNDASTMQNVVNNLHTFVQLYHADYSHELVTFAGQQIASIMRRLSDHSFDNVDSSPLLFIMALLAQGNRKHARELLSYYETCLRIALTRGQVSSECLIKLISATQPKITKPSEVLLGKVVTTLMEIMSDTLRMKARVLPTTLNSIITALMSDETPIFPDNPSARFKLLMPNMVDNASYFLDHHPWTDGQTEGDFNVSVSVARIILQTLEQDIGSKDLSAYQDTEITYRLVSSTRSWIVMAIAALQELDRRWPAILFPHLPAFMHSYTATMRPYGQCNLPSDLAATTYLNHAYIAIKVWLMVAQQTSIATREGERFIMRVWNGVWPMFDNALNALEMEAQAGGPPSTLMVLMSTSVVDLFSFLRTLHAPLALDLSLQASVMKRIKAASGESSHLKFNRTARGVESAPEPNFEGLVQQAAKDLIATEKLRIAESRREFGKAGMDRR